MSKAAFQEKFIELVSIIKEKMNIKNAIIRELKDDKLITKGYFGYGYEEAHIEIKVGYGVTGLCALRARTIVINDLSTYAGEYIKGIDNAKSEICIPIMKSNTLIGTLNIESEIINNFSRDKIDFLESLSAIMSSCFGEKDSSNRSAMSLAKSLAILENI